jgi:penicillin-binding protein 1C
VEPFVERLGALGFRNLERADFYGPSVALGSVDVTLWDLVDAYRTLANGGVYSPLRLVPGPLPPVHRVFSEDSAFVIGDILSDRVGRALTFGLDNGLATRFWTAVKTGTSKDMRDNWCVGFSARFTVGVWTGNFTGDPMWDVSGMSGAAPVWAQIMRRLHERVPSPSPAPPAGLVQASPRWGYAEAGPPSREWFLAGTEPEAGVRAGRHLAARARARIVYPTEGMIVALDPDIPHDRQALFFESAPETTGLRWALDGKDLGPARSSASWLPRPGRHRLELRDRAGRTADGVSFAVRGAAAVAAMETDTEAPADTEDR